MVGGERMTVAIKGQTAKNIVWETPFVMAGNEMLTCFQDKSGSFSRRVLLFAWDRVVSRQEKDSSLPQKLEQDLPRFIVRANRSYLQLVEEHGNEDVWNFVPQYFHDQQRKLREETDVMLQFINTADVVEPDPQGYVSFKEFQTAFAKFCDDTGKRRAAVTDDLCRSAFDEHGLRKDVGQYGNPPRMMAVILGLSFQ